MAGPYIFCAVGTGAGGVVAWDTSSDTQAAILLSAGSNLHSDHSLYMSSDGSTVYARGTVGVGKITTSTLAASIVPGSSGYAIPSLGNTNIGCSPDGSEFYVASPVSTNSAGVANVFLLAVNGTTGAVRTSVSLGALGISDQRQVGMAVSPDGTLLFLNGPITAYHTSDLSVAYITSIGGVSHYGSVMGFSPDGLLTYYYDETAGKIGTFRTVDGVAVSNVTFASVDDLVITTDGLSGYTSAIGGGSVTLFNTTPLALVRSVSLSPWIMGGVSITQSGSALYAGNGNTGAGQQIAKIPLPAFTTPAKFAFTGSAAGASIKFVVGRPFVSSLPTPPPAPPAPGTNLAWMPNTCEGTQISLAWDNAFFPVDANTYGYQIRISPTIGGMGVFDVPDGQPRLIVLSPTAIATIYTISLYTWSQSPSGGRVYSTAFKTIRVTPCTPASPPTPPTNGWTQDCGNFDQSGWVLEC